MARFIQATLVVWLALTCLVSHSQEKILWNNLSIPEQRVLQEVRPQWDSLPVERQQRLHRGAKRWLEMQPRERRQAQRQQRRFDNLPLTERLGINERFQRFNRLSREEQRRLRRIQQQYLSLPEAQRRILRDRFDNLDQARSADQNPVRQNTPEPVDAIDATNNATPPLTTRPDQITRPPTANTDRPTTINRSVDIPRVQRRAIERLRSTDAIRTRPGIASDRPGR